MGNTSYRTLHEKIHIVESIANQKATTTRTDLPCIAYIHAKLILQNILP
jgi:hypothetical protein